MRPVLIPCLLALTVATPAAFASPHRHAASTEDAPATEKTMKATKKEREKTAPSRPEAEPEDHSGLGSLMHASPERVKARLGDPDVARVEGKGAFWTYRLPHCALFLFFSEGPKGLRVIGADTGPRRRGEPLMGVSACLASALTPPAAADEAPVP